MITGQELILAGIPQGKIIGAILENLNLFSAWDKSILLDKILEVYKKPNDFISDPLFSNLAQSFIEASKPDTEISLNPSPVLYSIYGKEQIEQGALDQMTLAMQLPVTIAGALMPDAHQGYGLPIGGVLATRNTVIPYGVGVDIGCRMALSIYDIPVKHFEENRSKYKKELIAFTQFGAGAEWRGANKAYHPVLENKDFKATKFIASLYDKAAGQLGTSGGGNHFVEWGIIEFEHDSSELNIAKGKYAALLSHSGSRGFGATLAGYYTRLAKDICKLPKHAVNLAYLDLDTAEGQEYWLAMNLAGDYASACHKVIHDRLTKAIGGELLARIENHHNFAWKEKHDGKDVIVHRKGATPAADMVMGIIPGSMATPGYLVKGKGKVDAINSASHGAGRLMSRTQATKSIKKEDLRQLLKDNDITLIGAGLDEAPMAYKNIETVMAAQQDLVDIIAKFNPKIVRMADDGSRED